MKKAFLLLFAGTVVFSACLKNDTNSTPQCQNQDASKEDASMASFALATGMHPTKDTVYKYYYEIIAQGDGSVTPNDYSTISFTYTGKLLNGNIFDSSSTPISRPLGNLVDGFRLAIPKIKKNGHIKMVLPSYLAYGCNAVKNNNNVVIIPENSSVYFDVTVTNVQ